MPLDRGRALSIVPYEVQSSGRIVVDAMLNGQGPFQFAIDSAATGSFLVTRLRDELGLEPIQDLTATVHGAMASGSFSMVAVDLLSVGEVHWEDANLIALPANTRATSSIDGVLGADFLRQYTIEIETIGRNLRVYRPGDIGEADYQGWSRIEIEPRYFGNSDQPLHFLQVEIENIAVPALFDLGAGVNVLNASAARALRLRPVRTDERSEFSGALGSEVISARLGTQDLRTGRVSWRDESFLIADLLIFETLDYGDRPLAILGSGLFSQRDLIIDFTRSRLLVRTSMREVNQSVAAASGSDGNQRSRGEP